MILAVDTPIPSCRRTALLQPRLHERYFAFKNGIRGWKFTLFTWYLAAFSILHINLALAVFHLIYYGHGDRDGMQTLWNGECDRASAISTRLHIVINAMSLIIFSASGYFMRCLLAPTRAEVDAAHEKSIWLYIGVPSMRNMRFVSRKRVVMWWILAGSSMGLHML